MKALHHAAGITEQRVQEVRVHLGELMATELEAIIEDAAVRTMVLPGYAHLDISEVRPNTRRAMVAVRDALASGDLSQFGTFMADLAYARAKAGVLPRSFYDLSELAEDELNELAGRHWSEVETLLAASIVARRIGDGARGVIIESFQQAYLDTRAEVDHLVNQFSAPILPALPGVLVLPIVGAISSARAEQIIDAILSGITKHSAHTVILDLTGITDADASLPGHLQRAARAGELVGGRVMLVGVTPEVANHLASSSADLAQVPIRRTLAAALLTAARQRT